MSLQRSDERVATATQTSDSHARTHARTKNVLTEVDPLSVVDVRRAYDGLALIGEVLSGGILPSSVRHERIREGERERIPSHVRSAVWFRDKGRCEMCADGKQHKPWELDHIVPWSAGGADDSTNLRVLCAAHNQERSNYVTPVDTRPRMAATWWCDRCYGLGAEQWTYVGDRVALCPIHEQFPRRCAVMRNYEWARGNPESDWTPWHQRQTVLEPARSAYCAHCQMPGMTDVVL